MITYGRKNIYIDKEVNEANLPYIITEAMKIHSQNALEMQYLIDIYLGKQEILDRPEQYANGINNKVVLNYAEEIVRDILGYSYGKAAQYTQKKSEFREDIQLLSDVLDYENSYAVDLKCETFVSLVGLGYEITLPKGDFDDTPEIPLKLMHLDPRTTFFVKSGNLGNRNSVSCTYCDINEGNTKYRIFYVFTDTTLYIYKTKGTGNTIQANNLVDSYNHLLGGNPITIYENNLFLTGDFEKAITILNALNILASDGLNDIQQFVQSILVFVNAEIDQEGIDNLKKNRVLTIKSPESVDADAKYIYSNLDVNNIVEVRAYLLDALYSITGMPTRQSKSSGGDTGKASEYKEGWVQLEIVAKNKEIYFKESKKIQLRIVLNLLKMNNLVDEKLAVQYIKVDLPRNKNDNIQTKTQAYSTLVATNTLDDRDALEMVDITTDVNEIIARGKKAQEEKQKVLDAIQKKADMNKVKTNEE